MHVEGEPTEAEHITRLQISDLLHRYATAVDTKDWAKFRSCFTEDAETDYGVIGRWSDADAITGFMADVHVGMGDSLHMLHNIAIALETPERASAVSYVHAVQVPAGEPDEWIDAVGQYVDEIVRTGDGWRIARRSFRLTRTITSHDLRPARVS